MPMVERLLADAIEMEEYNHAFSGRVVIKPLERLMEGPPFRWSVKPRTPALRGVKKPDHDVSLGREHLILDPSPSFIITLPETYPRERPRVRSARPLFHPNVDEYTGEVCVISPSLWSPGVPLTQVVDQILAIVSWQKFNPFRTFDFLNEEAARFAQDQPTLVAWLRGLGEGSPRPEGTVRVLKGCGLR